MPISQNGNRGRRSRRCAGRRSQPQQKKLGCGTQLCHLAGATIMVMTQLARCFVAYPSAPVSRAETIEQAMEDLQNGGVVEVIGWKSLAVGGRVVIETICEEIRSRDLFIADVTALNPNVLFELGYAIAHRKR